MRGDVPTVCKLAAPLCGTMCLSSVDALPAVARTCIEQIWATCVQHAAQCSLQCSCKCFLCSAKRSRILQQLVPGTLVFQYGAEILVSPRNSCPLVHSVE
jgi:hypothetical protein